MAPRSEVGVNGLVPVVGNFFYPLVGRADKGAVATPAVLGRLLYVLGTLLQCCGRHAPLATTKPLTRTLLAVVLASRFHEAATVRQASLFCLLVCFQALPYRALLEELRLELEELLQWLVEAQRGDPEEGCRRHAAAVLQGWKELADDDAQQTNNGLGLLQSPAETGKSALCG